MGVWYLKRPHICSEPCLFYAFTASPFHSTTSKCLTLTQPVLHIIVQPGGAVSKQKNIHFSEQCFIVDGHVEQLLVWSIKQPSPCSSSLQAATHVCVCETEIRGVCCIAPMTESTVAVSETVPGSLRHSRSELWIRKYDIILWASESWPAQAGTQHSYPVSLLKPLLSHLASLATPNEHPAAQWGFKG